MKENLWDQGRDFLSPSKKSKPCEGITKKIETEEPVKFGNILPDTFF